MRKSLITISTALALSTGIFGCSKSVEDMFSFKYHGQDAGVKHENIRFASDNYWIEVGKDKIFMGYITTDDNKLITINPPSFNQFSIRDIKQKN